MRVGMDISQLAHKGGVSTYTRSITDQFSNISSLDMVYFYSSLRSHYAGNLRGVKSYRLPPTIFETLFNKWRNIPIEKFIGEVDIFHSSDWTQPPSIAKKVTTYHDVIPIKYPRWSTPKIVGVHKRRLKLVEKEIDFVIAVSESTKKDLLEVTNIPKEKIKVIYEGPSANFKLQTKGRIDNFKKKYNLPERFILAIGGIGERKNLERIKRASDGYNLVITGESIPYLDIEELELLYQSASVLLYASLYEGFGIPLVDAFLSGLPVITSNISSMPEVGGNAAIYVDPFDIEDMREKIENIMNDEQLKQEMIGKGYKRAKEFSWEKTALETAKVYRSLI